MKRLIGILADDLTGANDTGVQFAIQGWSTTVYLKEVDMYNYSDVLVLNSDSRYLSAEQAKARTFLTANALKNAGAERIYKKVDSVLRGNIGAELEAVMCSYGCKTAFLCPAFPQLGRTVRNGIVMMNHQAITRTDLSCDKITPVSSAKIADVIRLQSQVKVWEVRLGKVRQGMEELESHLRSFLERDEAVVAIDAETDDDLRTIAHAINAMEGDYAIAGSGGLARAMAQNNGSMLSIPSVDGKGILVVNGSSNKMALTQIDRLQESGYSVFPIAYSDLMSGNWKANEALTIVKNGGVAAISVIDQELCGNVKEKSRDIRNGLAEYVGRIMQHCTPKALVLMGGDTALSICLRLGGWGIRLLGEVEVGMAFGLLQSNWMQNLLVATKSGSFGSPDTIKNAVSYLLGLRQKSCKLVDSNRVSKCDAR